MQPHSNELPRTFGQLSDGVNPQKGHTRLAILWVVGGGFITVTYFLVFPNDITMNKPIRHFCSLS